MTTKQSNEYQPSRDLQLYQEYEELTYQIIEERYELMLKLLKEIADFLGRKINNIITFKNIDVKSFIIHSENIYYIIKKKKYTSINELFRDLPDLQFYGSDIPDDVDDDYEPPKNSKSVKTFKSIIKFLKHMLKQINYILIINHGKICIRHE